MGFQYSLCNINKSSFVILAALVLRNHAEKQTDMQTEVETIPAVGLGKYKRRKYMFSMHVRTKFKTFSL